MAINRVVLTGNLTRDPELRQTAKGVDVLSFCVAVSDRRRNSEGVYDDYPNFIDCVMFGNYAVAMEKHLLKGQKVAIDGRLRYSSWEGEDGQRRSKLNVVAERIDLIFPKGERRDQPKERLYDEDCPF